MKLRHKEQGALTNLASTTTASFYSLWVAFVGHVWSVLLRFFDVVTPPLIRFVLAVSGLPRIVTLWLVQLFTLKLSGFIIRSFAEMEYSDTGKVFCWFPRAYLLVGVRVHTVLGYTWHLGRVLTMELLHRLYVRGMVTCNTVTVAQPSDEISDTTTLYIRRMYFAISDIFNRPISGGPGSWVPVMNRKWEGDVLNNNLKLVLTGEERKCLNLSSYNYLGFGGFHPTVTPLIEETLRSTPISLAAPRIMKCSDEQLLAELKIARFVGKEDAFIVPMGFCTNSTVIPQLVGERCLILSDYFNHASIISGTRLSKATVRIFKHNNMHDLQMHLDLATSEISSGKQHWRKIMIIVEGLYSMEGDLCPLPQLVELKKLYGAYLYVDEAHSIGAVGPSGKGVCDFYGVDPNQVDILMGTFTKSFASIGGYVAGSRDLISHLRTSSAAAVHGTPLPPPCARQICEVIDALSSDDGRQQIAQLHKNSTLFRQGLANMGCWILGNPNSPVVPILLHHPNKITAFSRQCLENSIAVVCVGYPATQLFYARARFCISSAHKEEDLYEALAKIAPVVKSVGVDYFKYWTRTPKNEDLHVSKRPGLIPSSFEPLRPSLSVFPHSPPVSSLVDFYSFDFLGLSDEATTKEACAKTMKLYGCGACGPRGFYGTTAEHLALDKALAEFTNTEQAVVYSYGLSVMSSVLPALLPQVIVYDSAANFSIMMGIQLAKCPNFSFNHNDMNSLGQVLEVVGADHPNTRTLVVTEGVFVNTGDICPLVQLYHLRDVHGFILVVDESLSLGTLGATGHGVGEIFDEFGGARRRYDHIVVASLEYSVAAMGGFCCGPSSLVGTQPLSGAAYCFSAAMPPFLCTAAMCSLQAIPSLLPELQKNAAQLWNALRSKPIPGLSISNDQHNEGPFDLPPVIHLSIDQSLAAQHSLTFENQLALLKDIEAGLAAQGVAVTCVPTRCALEEEPQHNVVPSVRLCIHRNHAAHDIDALVFYLQAVAKSSALNSFLDVTP